MLRKYQSIILLAVVAIVFVAGCSPSAQTAATIAPTSQPTTIAVESTATPESVAEATEAQDSTVSVDCTKLNLNDLTEGQLMSTIPDFTSRMVREFFEYRPYVSIQQFRREIGKYVDEAQVTEWEQYVYVPINPNDSDADTLMQLPGVDEAAAASLAEGRPYADNGAFLAALAGLVTADQAAQAACYLAA